MKTAAFVTGAGRGIGASIAQEFHARGYFVFLSGRNEKNLRQIASSLPNSEVLLCDLDRPEQVSSAVENALARKDTQLEVLVNNAGIFQTHTTLEGGDDLWMAQFQTNLLGPVRLTRALWPHFARQKKGVVINISSTLGLKPSATTSAYSAVKAAMINWTQALALEGGPLGIRANCVCPGLVDTPIHSFHSLPESQKAEALQKMAGLQPLGRVGVPKDIADAVVFLASENSSWTTGAVLSVDGGINLT